MDKRKKHKTYTRRAGSIARKINSGFWWDNFFRMAFYDILIVAMFAAGYIWHFEDGLGKLVTDRDFAGYTYYTFSYVVTLEDGSEASFFLFEMLRYIYPALIVLVSVQTVGLFFGLFKTGRIRRKLKPLNDLAIKAEEISQFSLDDSKMQQLEAAIENASPYDEEIRIATGDKELVSIEIALNNLLRRMKETQKAQARFVSDASHELRTPISVIQGYVNMLDRWGKEDPEVLSESIDALKNESEHMKELIEQLLFLARGDSGRNTLHFAGFDLRKTMQEVWEESLMIDEKHEYVYRNAISDDELEDSDEPSGSRTDESGNTIKDADGQSVQNGGQNINGKTAGNTNTGESLVSGKEKNRSPYMVYGDEAMIKQSIRIFVQNASKYSGEGDTITLDVKNENGYVSFMVQDEGVGMAQEDVMHIFERFYRSDKARNSGTGGSGLGLSIAKWITDAHNARIDVFTRPELGTRFTVSFPAKSA